MLIRQLYRFSFGAKQIINPYSQQVVDVIDKQSVEINKLINEMKERQIQWNELKINDRVIMCQQLKEEIIKNKIQISEHITDCIGKTIKQSREEVQSTIETVEELIENAEIKLKDQIITQNDITEIVRKKQPIGIAYVWFNNYQMYLIIQQILPQWQNPLLSEMISSIPNLLCGNSSIIGQSKFPNKLSQFYDLSQLPVFHLQQNQINVELLRHKDVKICVYDGDHVTGRRIYELLNHSTLSKLSLQLKHRVYIFIFLYILQKQACYICEHCDLEQHIDEIVQSIIVNNGQNHTCVQIILVHNKIHQDLIDLLVQKVKKLKYGDPNNEDTDISISIKDFQSEIDQFRQKQIENVIWGGKQVTLDDNKFTYEPLLLNNARLEYTIQNFPMVNIIPVIDVEQATTILNENPFIQGVSIYTQDKREENLLLSQIEKGNIYINKKATIHGYMSYNFWQNTGKGFKLSEDIFDKYTQFQSYHLIL